MNHSSYKQMVKHAEQKLGLTETPTMNRSVLKAIIKEEYSKIREELEEQAPKIEKKLESMRKEMFKEYLTREKVGSTFKERMEKRIQIKTVSEMIETPVNELTLYFLNNVKNSNDRHLVEYHLGHIYFYAN